jgi:hypothetical protein
MDLYQGDSNMATLVVIPLDHATATATVRCNKISIAEGVLTAWKTYSGEYSQSAHEGSWPLVNVAHFRFLQDR